MTIINATQYLKRLLGSSELNRIGKFTGFCQRLRDIQPARLLPALLSGLGCDMAWYRCRWQIELLFKELKSHNRLKAFATRQKAIAEGLIWASLLALLVKRRLALTLIGSAELSMLKIAKNSALWLMPILASIIHGAWQEITEKLEWVMVYLSKNGKKSKQRKSKQNNTLDCVVNSLAA